MPEAVIAPVSSTPAPQPAAQPAPQSTAPAGQPTQVVDPQIALEASKALGAEPGHGRPEPASDEGFDEPEGQPAIEPVQPGDPNAAQTTPVAEGAQPPQPVTQPVYGEEFLKELNELLPPEEIKPVQVQTEPDITKPEEWDKISNPDGKADPETRLKNAQSYIGKLQQTKGEEIKVLKGQIGQLLEGGKDIQKLFRKNESGQMQYNADGILDFSLQAPQHEMEAALAKRGVKLVPLDAKVDVSDDPAVAKWENEWANAAIPGDELTVDEKIAQIAADPRLNKRMIVDQSAWQASRRQQYENQQAQNRQRTQAEAQKDRELVDGYMAGLKTKPDYATVWLPLVKRCNAMIPNSVRGQERIRQLSINMQAFRFPAVLKDATAKAYEQGRKDMAALRSMGAIPAMGEQPDLTTGELDEAQPGQPVASNIQKEAEKVLGARAGSI